MWGQQKKYSHYIGIDPGVETGYAHWERLNNKFRTVQSMEIHKALFQVLHFHMANFPMLVRVEDARLRTWFDKSGPEVWKGAGSIMRDCKIWDEFLNDYGIDHQFVAPKHNKTKVTHDYFIRQTGWAKPTNEHARDAAMLVYGY